ncbi:MAG: hypothetical protein KGJ98_01775 [Chloroflexota bacterium]|nr:hypothetical protein [Chloroflexota bacterium]
MEGVRGEGEPLRHPGRGDGLGDGGRVRRARAVADAGERHVGTQRLAVEGDPVLVQGAPHGGAGPLDLAPGIRRRPHDPRRPVLWEKRETGERDAESGHAAHGLRERGAHTGDAVLPHLPDEGERDVQQLRRDPPQRGKAARKRVREGRGDPGRDGDGGEEARHTAEPRRAGAR